MSRGSGRRACCLPRRTEYGRILTDTDGHGPAVEREIRAALPRTWHPFFSRFGRLTEVQVQAIPASLSGHNVVVISPAASGKTEAAVAPAVERLLPERR